MGPVITSAPPAEVREHLAQIEHADAMVRRAKEARIIAENIKSSTAHISALVMWVDSVFADSPMDKSCALMLRATVRMCQITIDYLSDLECHTEYWTLKCCLDNYVSAVDELDDRVETHEISLTIAPVLRGTIEIASRG